MIGKKGGLMAQMTQIELLRQFLEENLQEGNAGNRHVLNNQYLHYKTPILERYEDKYILNQTRYSIVTGQIQKTNEGCDSSGKTYCC